MSSCLSLKFPSSQPEDEEEEEAEQHGSMPPRAPWRQGTAQLVMGWGGATQRWGMNDAFVPEKVLAALTHRCMSINARPSKLRGRHCFHRRTVHCRRGGQQRAIQPPLPPPLQLPPEHSCHRAVSSEPRPQGPKAFRLLY
jgi:hypothetical protein